MRAWGGVADAEIRDAGESWPVHLDVRQFVLEGYRRGLRFGRLQRRSRYRRRIVRLTQRFS
eukprot:932737-Karenia_brevis.AAC.1